MSDTPRMDAIWGRHVGDDFGFEDHSGHLYLEGQNLERELAEVRAQLPEEMQGCDIVFKQCGLGHAWLTATNWVQRECQTCELAEAVTKERERCALVVEKVSIPYENTSSEAADAIRKGE